MRNKKTAPNATMIAVICAVAVLVGCRGEPDIQGGSEPSIEPRRETVPEPLLIYTVHYPLQYWAERIGGERVDVRFPAPTGEDPAYWRPSAEEVAAYQRADLILLNGAGYAKWLGLASLPQSTQVDTSAGITDRLIPLSEGPVHSHGPEGEHSHKGTAFTTWLDPDLAVVQARAVLEALATARPEYRNEFERAYDELVGELEDLSTGLTRALSQFEGDLILFSHPVYQYLSRRYGLDSRSVHFEPEQMPTAEQWSDLDQMLAQRSSSLMIWEDTPGPEIESALSERGIESVVFRTCANRPETGDYLSVMRQNVTNLEGLESP